MYDRYYAIASSADARPCVPQRKEKEECHGEGRKEGSEGVYDGGYNKQATKYNGEATTTVAARDWLASYLQPDQGGGDGDLSSGPTTGSAGR